MTFERDDVKMSTDWLSADCTSPNQINTRCLMMQCMWAACAWLSVDHKLLNRLSAQTRKTQQSLNCCCSDKQTTAKRTWLTWWCRFHGRTWTGFMSAGDFTFNQTSNCASKTHPQYKYRNKNIFFVFYTSLYIMWLSDVKSIQSSTRFPTTPHKNDISLNFVIGN